MNVSTTYEDTGLNTSKFVTSGSDYDINVPIHYMFEKSISFSSNKYIQKFEDIWKIIKVLGEELLQEHISILEDNGINEYSIEKLFEYSTKVFFINNTKTLLFSNKDQAYEERFGESLTEYSASDSLRTSGSIENLEKAIESNYIQLK